MVIFTAIIVHCWTAEVGGFLRVIALRLNLIGYTTLEVGWESIYLIKTSQTVIQEFTGYQMGFNGSTVNILCYLKKWKLEENFNFTNVIKNRVKNKLAPDVPEEKCFLWSNKKCIICGHCETPTNVQIWNYFCHLQANNILIQCWYVPNVNSLLL